MAEEIKDNRLWDQEQPVRNLVDRVLAEHDQFIISCVGEVRKEIPSKYITANFARDLAPRVNPERGNDEASILQPNNFYARQYLRTARAYTQTHIKDRSEPMQIGFLVLKDTLYSDWTEIRHALYRARNTLTDATDIVLQEIENEKTPKEGYYTERDSIITQQFMIAHKKIRANCISIREKVSELKRKYNVPKITPKPEEFNDYQKKVALKIRELENVRRELFKPL
ncbi:MAG TPA: hypothetical protein VJK51_03760 [Candidatus Nanoarchaeia archaeon]|nr:hypothetical protein [Candidatus Nanoarchaeia archaeon]